MLGQVLYGAGDIAGAHRDLRKRPALRARPSAAHEEARTLAAGGLAARAVRSALRGALHRAVRRTGRGPAGGARRRDPRKGLLEDWRRALQLSARRHHRRPLHARTVPRRDPVAGLGRRRVRRAHPGAGAGRAAEHRGVRARAHPRADPRLRPQHCRQQRAAVDGRGAGDVFRRIGSFTAGRAAEERAGTPAAGAPRRLLWRLRRRPGAHRLRGERRGRGSAVRGGGDAQGSPTCWETWRRGCRSAPRSSGTSA